MCDCLKHSKYLSKQHTLILLMMATPLFVLNAIFVVSGTLIHYHCHINVSTATHCILLNPTLNSINIPFVSFYSVLWKYDLKTPTRENISSNLTCYYNNYLMNYIDTEVTRGIQSLLGFAPPDARLSYILVQH